MTRQVDVKALVSHIVRGDGANKCRICLGDTTEGQVYLSDTVMMDGDKAVTLSEILETITGIKVVMEGDLPEGVCPECSRSAINAAEFILLCQAAAQQWDTTIALLHDLPTQCTDNKTVFAIIDKNKMIAINDMKKSYNHATAAHRLTKYLSKCPEPKKDSLYKCPNCDKCFSSPIKFSLHLKESPDLQRACYVCGIILSQNILLNHLIKKHKEKPFSCKKCTAVFRSYNQYIHHVEKTHKFGRAFCGDCGRSFQSLNAYHAHVSIHVSKNCPSCDKLFRNHSCYMHHTKNCCELDSKKKVIKKKKKVIIEINNAKNKSKINVGLRGATYKECVCDYCGKTFARKKFVCAHIQIVHMRNTHRPCIYCGKLLASAHMSEHIKQHKPDRTFTCEQCGIILKTKLGYNQHIRLHTGERPYECKQCGETFSASSRRSEHIRKVHKTKDIILKQECHLCPAKFRLPYRLKSHLRSVHNDDQDQTPQFECAVCHEKFSSSRGLNHHSRKHQNVTLVIRKPGKIVLNMCSEEKKEEFVANC